MVAIGSQLFTKLVDCFVILVYVGAGVLGYAGAETIIGDKTMSSLIAPYATAIKMFLTIAVIFVGHWRRKRKLSECSE